MNEPFTTPQIPELIISYPFGGNISRPNNHVESGLRSPKGKVWMARTTQTALPGESDWY